MSTDTFDAVMARLDYSMIIVTTMHDGEPGGCLVGFHTQCSIDPPRYAVWISRENHTARVAARAEVFALHFLDGTNRAHQALAELFGTVTDDTRDKFASCEWHPGRDGVPLLDACPVHLVGRRDAVLDTGGDHIAYVLEPLTVEMTGTLTPLMFSQVRDLDAGHEVD
jgi:flavin reductase (DIM6/NTAB) family NADH-FMN oxidoreductase RutF